MSGLAPRQALNTHAKQFAAASISKKIQFAMTETKRGGPGRGQGRKPVKQGEETVTLSLRVTVAQREKLARLGGAEWVRCKIDKAKET